MSGSLDWEGEMRGSPLDDATADRLLSGRLAPDDAPPGYAGVAAVVQAAAGPVSAGELAGEQLVVAAGVAAVRSTLRIPPTPSRRSSMLGKLLSAKVAAAATVAVLGAGTAAAAVTHNLPSQTSHASAHAAGLATAGTATARTATARARGTTAAGPAAPKPAPPVGPLAGMSHGQATFGLCTAFLAGNSAGQSSPSTSGRANSVAFRALVAAHGGNVASTTAFCQAYVAAHHPGSPPAVSTTRPHTGPPASTGRPVFAGPPASTGRPVFAGPPAGTGKPANAGNSGLHAVVPTPNQGGTGTAGTASGGHSSHGASTAGSVSHGASGAGSGNAGGHGPR